jgi:ubiquitin carboxyl-terminal hydrolase L3
MGKRWVPLESNPDVLNEFAKKIGARADKYIFHDVYGFDEVWL